MSLGFYTAMTLPIVPWSTAPSPITRLLAAIDAWCADDNEETRAELIAAREEIE